jgi:hypothetical protein
MNYGAKIPVFQTMNRLVKKLREAGIPYAVMGAMAVNLHRSRSLTEDAAVLLTRHGLDQFRRLRVREYEPIPNRSRRFTDRRNGTMVEVFLTGHHPGREGPIPLTFPDPDEASEEIDGIRVLKLLQLIEVKLAAGRYYDLAEVVFLIRAHQLNDSFASQLHPSLREAFIGCLEENRRDDEFESQDGK